MSSSNLQSFAKGRAAARTWSALFLATWALIASAGARPFDIHRDVFAFSNDTALAYGVDEQGNLHISKRAKPVQFSHRCFVLARGAMQFYQFARFEPSWPKVSREEYRRRLQALFRISVWRKPPRAPIILPGFRDLHDFSIAYEGLLKETLGNWVPSYLRIGNWRMAMGHPRAGQAAAARWLVASVREGKVRALYICRFPWMNHAIVVYGAKTLPNGDVHFSVYDPNYPQEAASLDYSAAERSFSFPKRWYFPGGRVNAMRIFISPFH